MRLFGLNFEASQRPIWFSRLSWLIAGLTLLAFIYLKILGLGPTVTGIVFIFPMFAIAYLQFLVIRSGRRQNRKPKRKPRPAR